MMSDFDNERRIRSYYDHTESRWGYRLLLGGTKHFGWYEPGMSKWRFGQSMRNMESQLLNALSLSPGEMVLDAGCGMGDVSRFIAKNGSVEVTGIDILDFNIDVATKRSRRQGMSSATHFVVGSYHELPFEDEAFDAVYTMETLVHSDDPRRAMGEFFRVLKPGGRLVNFEYEMASSDSMPVNARDALTLICKDAEMPAWLDFRPGVFEDYLAKVGFTILGSENIKERMLPMLKAFSILGIVPYTIAQKTGKVGKVINAMSGVEMYRFWPFWEYRVYRSQRPAAA